MPGTTLSRGNVLNRFLCAPTFTWSGTVGATSTAEITASLPGLKAGDKVSLAVQGSGQTAGLILMNARCAADNVLSAQFYNTTGGAVSAAAGPYTVEISRAESTQYLPTSAV